MWYNGYKVKQMIENFDSMIAASLQLEEPWYVSGATYDPEKQQMDIGVKVRESAKLGNH